MNHSIEKQLRDAYYHADQYAGGSIESLEATTKLTEEILSRLLIKLVDAGHLSTNEVKEIIGS